MQPTATPPNPKLVYQAGIEAVLRAVDWEKNPQLRAEIVQCGYDPARPQREYSYEVIVRLIDLLAARCFPGVGRQEAYERLGHAAFKGYRATLIGRVVLAALQLTDVPHALQMAVRGFQSVTNYVIHEVLIQTPGHHLIYRVHHSTTPDRYVLGLIKELMESAGHKGIQYEIDARTMPEYVDFHLRW